MPGQTQPFLPMGGSMVMTISTAPLAVQVSTASVSSLILTNFSTNPMTILISALAATTMSTLSTAPQTASGFILGAAALGVTKQMTVSCPPAPFVQGMTTGTGLTGILGISPGEGMI